MVQLIENKVTEIIHLCVQHDVVSISVFGSAAKSQMTIDCDIEFLVQFSDAVELLDYADNYFDLKDSFMNYQVGK